MFYSDYYTILQNLTHDYGWFTHKCCGHCFYTWWHNILELQSLSPGQKWCCVPREHSLSSDTCCITLASYSCLYIYMYSCLCPHLMTIWSSAVLSCKLLNVPSGDSRSASASCKIKTVMKVHVTWCALLKSEFCQGVDTLLFPALWWP